jgi:hypothetical protein
VIAAGTTWLPAFLILTSLGSALGYSATLNNSIRAARARVFLAVVAESGDVAARVRLEELKGEPAWLAKRGQAGEGEWNADE